MKFEITETGYSGNLEQAEGLTQEGTLYFKTFDTLEELVAFAEGTGGMVVLLMNNDPPILEIYNDYRE